MKGTDNMEIKEFFDSNFSHILEDCSCPDHKTSFNEILERAKKMEKSKENRHRLSGIAAGIVGTAAVLAGAVFGLNWLNEHGGLREGGIESSNGAGYHDTAADTTYTQPEVTMTPVIVPEDFVYRFNGFTMKPRHYNYDGMTLELTYDIIYDNGISDNSENDIELRVFGGNVKVNPQDTTQLLFKRDNTAELMWKHTSLEVLESLEIWIMPGSESAISSDMTGQYKFTVGIPEDSPYLSVDTDKAIGKAETDTAKLTHFNICKNTVGFVVEDYPISDPAFEAVINYTDGTFEPLTAEIISVNDMSGDNRQYFLYRLYGTDINTVKSVTVNGREINADGSYEIEFENFIGITKAEARAYLEENNRNFDFIEMDSDEPAGIIFKQEPPAGKTVSSSVTAELYVSAGKDIMDAAGDVIEFDGLTATIKKVDFDGTFLRVYYTPSDYEESFGDPNTYMVIHSARTENEDRKLICSVTGRDEDTHTIVTSAYIDLDEGETFDLVFGLYSGEKSGRYKLTGTDKSENTVTVYDFGDDNTGDIRWLRLSPFGVVTAGSENFYFINPKYSVEIEYNDGSTLNLYPAGWSGGASGEKIEKLFGLKAGARISVFGLTSYEPINVENVSAVVINGTEIPIMTE